MTKTNLKIIVAGLFSFLFPLSALAAQPFNLNSLSADGLAGLNLAIPQAGA